MKENEPFEAIGDASSPADCADNRGKRIIEQQDVTRFFRHFRAGDAHGHAHIRRFNGRGVIDAIAGDGHRLATRFECIDYAQFDGGGGARNHAHGVQRIGEGGIIKRLQFGRRHGTFAAVQEVQRFRDGARRQQIVACKHHHLNSGGAAGGDGFGHFGADRIGNRRKTIIDPSTLRITVRKGQHAAGAILPMRHGLLRRSQNLPAQRTRGKNPLRTAFHQRDRLRPAQMGDHTLRFR